MSVRVVDVNEKLSHKMTIEAASKPEIKFWPKRGFVTILSVLATFMATALILVFIRALSQTTQRLSHGVHPATNSHKKVTASLCSRC